MGCKDGDEERADVNNQTIKMLLHCTVHFWLLDKKCTYPMYGNVTLIPNLKSYIFFNDLSWLMGVLTVFENFMSCY